VHGDERHGGLSRETGGVTATTVEFHVPADFRVFPLDDPPAELAGVADGYAAAHVVYAANQVRDCGGQVRIGCFTVTLEPFDETDPETAARAIAGILAAQADRVRAVALVSLPCGPAVATEELRPMNDQPLGQAQVFVKPAGWPGLVVLTMATPDAGHLASCTRELARIAESLRFGRPLSTDAEIGAAEAG
jgi:hypothetical protein